MIKIYAGLDLDATAKLFIMDDKGDLHLIKQEDWIKITVKLNLEPGEMPIAYLQKDIQA